ncbi:MAG: hypothetical protein Q9187_001952 [Circinaria calcarea]
MCLFPSAAAQISKKASALKDSQIPESQTSSYYTVNQKNSPSLGSCEKKTSVVSSNKPFNYTNAQGSSFHPLGSSPHAPIHDWRLGNIVLQSIDMLDTKREGKHLRTISSQDRISHGIEGGPNGLATKGRYEPTDLDEEDLGWGVVRLYRDTEETPELYEDAIPARSSRHGRGSAKRAEMGQDPPFRDEDCTTLCILAVPSYLTSSDFLGFVGEKTREEVSHFRMIRTERVNRYMVLMKFRSGKQGREWRKNWNGKPFNSMEPENCHVVFVKSIEFRSLKTIGQERSFPDMTNDPFTPPIATSDVPSIKSQPSTAQSAALSAKPKAPPTPALVELPTCPVCLERMDESTGLLTILCQHVFHCSCLQKWKGSGCPVCRFAQDGFGKRGNDMDGDLDLNECSICRSDANLWICLICGNVGCGRYDAAHAFFHYQQTSHCFAMDLTTQRVWDYASDGYVHRIVQTKTDGKLVELPSSATRDTFSHDDDYDDFVPREKLDTIGLEYTHLLTSQLESQRMYFEEKVERAADKASQASVAATQATESASQALSQLSDLKLAHETLAHETIPTLERDKDRALRKAEKFEAMARKLEKEWREEKAINGSLMERIEFMNQEMEGLKAENAELKDVNRDLGFFISGSEKLKGAGEEVMEGKVSLPDPPSASGPGVGGEGKKKGGKGKKGP